mmetsp:Transcript_104033/g.171217  ORF Transcript_104033/g.171217 Transcript_104033/m.171217 type:complete len:196 (-) Transcript_104033:34-621(-)
MCRCSFGNYFSYSGLALITMPLGCLFLAQTCPYKMVCPPAHYILLMLAAFTALQGIIMMSVGHGFAVVDKLSLEDLNPELMNRRTKRWGCVAKTCPAKSRYLHLINMCLIFTGACCAGPCEEVDNHGEYVCSSLDTAPQPLRDFGLLSLTWFFVSILGCNVQRKHKNLPHVYEPEPAERPRTVKRACALTTLCHP